MFRQIHRTELRDRLSSRKTDMVKTEAGVALMPRPPFSRVGEKGQILTE